MLPWPKIEPFLFALITIVCLFRAFYLNREATAALYTYSQVKHAKEGIASLRNASKDSITMGDRPDNIFYFVQVSDLHISAHDPMGHTPHFLHFLSTIFPVLSPPFVLATGDLTDAKDAAKIRSSQIETEWQTYHRALSEAGILNRTDFWYDLRGNHDCFNVPDDQSEENFYARYGVSRFLTVDGKVWGFDKSPKHSGGRYRFIGLDACPRRGPSRPFNFFGYLDGDGMDLLEQELARAEGANHTFVFGHYPTTTLLFGQTSTGKNFNDLSHEISVYLCGHLHQLLGGIGKTLKSRLPNYLELELSDMKMHASYRIVAVDHDIVSYTDLEVPLTHIPFLGELPDLSKPHILPARIPSPPIVLFTNPKDSRYIIPQGKEPVYRIRHSQYIRMLIFTDTPGSVVATITIDGVLHSSPVTYAGRGSPGVDEYMPLYVAEWDPSVYDDGLAHTIKATVVDSDGKKGVSEDVIFRVDGNITPMHGAAGEWIIWSDLTFLLRVSFIIMYVIVVGLLLFIPKVASLYLHWTDNYDSWLLSKTATLHSITHLIVTYPLSTYPKKNLIYRMRHLVHRWHLRLLLLANSPTWFLLYLYALWLIAMPWFWGEFIPAASDPAGRDGFFYLYGLYQHSASDSTIKGTWLPLTDTWFYAVFDFGFGYVFWVIWFALVSISSPLMLYGRLATTSRMWYRSWIVRLVIVIFWVWRAAECVGLAGFYGGVARQSWRNIGSWWLLILSICLSAWNGGALVSEKAVRECSCPVCRESEEERRGLLRDGSGEEGGNTSSRESSTGGIRRRGTE